jgi:hypothetical protein
MIQFADSRCLREHIDNRKMVLESVRLFKIDEEVRLVLSKGEKILVIRRRLFEEDIRRHFVGEVEEVSPELVRLNGYAFIFDDTDKEFKRRSKLQTNIFSLVDAGIAVIVLPEEIDLEAIRYTINDKGQRVLTDGNSFYLQVSEFGVNI